MEDFGRGLVGTAVAVDAGAVADVDVFQIGKMVLVEIADLVQDTFAVDGGAAAGCEDFGGVIVIGGGFSFAAGIGPAEDAVLVTGIINAVMILPLKHLGADCEDVLITFYCINKGFYEARQHFGVVIKQENVGRVRLLYSDIYRMAKSGIFGQCNQIRLGIVVTDEFHAAVC